MSGDDDGAAQCILKEQLRRSRIYHCLSRGQEKLANAEERPEARRQRGENNGKTKRDDGRERCVTSENCVCSLKFTRLHQNDSKAKFSQSIFLSSFCARLRVNGVAHFAQRAAGIKEKHKMCKKGVGWRARVRQKHWQQQRIHRH